MKEEQALELARRIGQIAGEYALGRITKQVAEDRVVLAGIQYHEEIKPAERPCSCPPLCANCQED